MFHLKFRQNSYTTYFNIKNQLNYSKKLALKTFKTFDNEVIRIISKTNEMFKNLSKSKKLKN